MKTKKKREFDAYPALEGQAVDLSGGSWWGGVIGDLTGSVPVGLPSRNRGAPSPLCSVSFVLFDTKRGPFPGQLCGSALQ